MKFEDAIEKIEDNDIGAFKDIWNMAIESCAQIAQDSIEHQIADECRDLKTK